MSLQRLVVDRQAEASARRAARRGPSSALEVEQAGVVARRRPARKSCDQAGVDVGAVEQRHAAAPYGSMPRSSQMRRKMMRSMVCCTAKLSSRWLRGAGCAGRCCGPAASRQRLDLGAGRRRRPRRCRACRLWPSAYLSNEPLRTASREKTPAISSQRVGVLGRRSGRGCGRWRPCRALSRLDAAVVDGELLEVGQDATGAAWRDQA